MAMATFKDHFLKYANRKYFVTGAEDIQIGSYGTKRYPANLANYLDKWKDLVIDKAEIAEATVVDIDFSRSSSAHLKGHIKGGKTAEGSAEGTYEQLKSGSLKLMKLAISRGNMVDLLNADEDVLKKLRDYRARDRVCHEVFVVIKAELAEKISGGGSISASGTDDGVEIGGEVGGKGSSSNNITISAGTTLAYGMFKPVWNGKRKDTSATIEDTKPDQYGA